MTPENPFPLVKPLTPGEARKVVKEQVNALSREEERNRNIQAALERYKQVGGGLATWYWIVNRRAEIMCRLNTRPW